MNFKNNINKAILVLAAILVMVPNLIFGGGYLIVSSTGVPYKWAPGVPVPYNPDGGGLGTLANPAAIIFVDAALAKWATTSIPTTDLSFVTAGTGLLAPDCSVDTVPVFFAIFIVIDGLSSVVVCEVGSLL